MDIKKPLIIGLTRVRNESHLIQDTLDHLSEFCNGGIFVYDDCSTDDTVQFCMQHPNVKYVIRGRKWDTNRAKAEYENRQALLLKAKEFASPDDWFVYIDADERIEFDWQQLFALKDSIIAIRMKLFDFYITPDDIYKQYFERKWIGPEYREIIIAFKNTEHLSYKNLDQREVTLGPGKILNAGFVKHYGKAISIEEWEKTCDYYIQYFPLYSNKWKKRKGKAVHYGVSDFGNSLITWDEKEKKGFLLTQSSNLPAKLRILLTNHHLLNYTGSEVYTLTIAKYLKQYGFDVVVYSKYVGKIGKEFIALGIPVINELEKIKNIHFDLAHVHHNINAAEVRLFFPNLPIVFLSHGIIPFLEQPSVFELNISHYLCISEEVKQNLISKNIPEEKITIIRNIIDNQKFKSSSKINPEVKKILVISAKIEDEKANRIIEACNRLNIQYKFIGGRFGEVTQEELLNLIYNSDLIFSMGRGAIEAMLCKRAVIVYDTFGADGMVTLKNFDEIKKYNFSGRCFRKDLTVDGLIEEIKKYNPEEIELLYHKVYDIYSADKAIPHLINVYYDVLSKITDDFKEVDFSFLNSFYNSLQETRIYSTLLERFKNHNTNNNVISSTSSNQIKEKIIQKITKHLKNVESKKKEDIKNRKAINTYDILIPIYNAYDHVKICVESVIKHTPQMHNIYLLNDASTDKRILPLLNEFAKNNKQIKVLSNERNLGFIGTLNRGFELSQNDVIILNSDTQVTSNWVEKLHYCLTSNPNAGIVSPLSNNATILSVPQMNSANKLPDNLSVDEFAQIVEKVSSKTYPEIPTAVGFCMLITRKVLNDVGYFDPIFGLGYGEENDLCERAKQKGYKILCADDTYIHHFGEASFSFVDKIQDRRALNQKILEERWPNYNNEIFEFCRKNPLRQIQEKIYFALNKSEKPSILQVIHNYNARGGVELHTQDISEILNNNFDISVMYPKSVGYLYSDAITFIDKSKIRHIQIAKENNLANEHFNYYPGDIYSELIESNFVNFIAGGNYDIIHFQHLLNWSTLLLPLIAKAMGKKIVISLHDYFLLCPDYTLLFPYTLNRCGKNFANPNDKECLYCISSKRIRRDPKNATPISEYLEERQFIIKLIFENADLIIAPSQFVKNKFITALGENFETKIKVIEHGIKKLQESPRPQTKEFLNVGFVGKFTTIKGANLLIKAAPLLNKSKIRFVIYGGVSDDIQKKLRQTGFIIRGEYKRENLPKILKDVDLVLIPSITDETFNLVLNEVLSMRIPTLVADTGAMKERVKDGENGFTFKTGDVNDLVNKLLFIKDNPKVLERIHKNLKKLNLKTIEENALDYKKIYDFLLATNAESSNNFNLIGYTKIKVSVIVLTHNALRYTKEFYNSLLNSTRVNYEIIFVDNNSSDGTKEYLDAIQTEAKNIQVIFNKENIGFPAGVNLGIQAAKGEYILIANNDIVVTAGWLDRLIEVAESDIKIGIVGPISNEVSGLQKDKDANYKSIDEMHLYAISIKNKNRNKVLQFPRVAFFCTLIKKEVINKIGGLDERFTPGNYEDDDFCLRAQLAGYKIVIAQDVFIHHYGSKSFKSKGEEKYIEQLKINYKIFTDKWQADPDGIWIQKKPFNHNRTLYFSIHTDEFVKHFERAKNYIKDKEYDRALSSLELSLEQFDLSEQATSILSKEDLLLLTANISLINNDLQKARSYFEAALQLNPDSSEACVGLGQIFYQTKNFEVAKTMFEWAVKNNPANNIAVESLKNVNQILNFPETHNSLFEAQISNESEKD